MLFCLPQACYEEVLPEGSFAYGGFVWVPSLQPRFEFAVNASTSVNIEGLVAPDDDDDYPYVYIYLGVDLSTAGKY